MAQVTVSQLAKLVKIDENVLLQKLNQSGAHKKNVQEMVTDQEKGALLAFIRSHNTKTKKEPIVLQRTTRHRLKVSGNRKVNVEIRKKKVLTRTPKEAPEKTLIEENTTIVSTPPTGDLTKQTPSGMPKKSTTDHSEIEASSAIKHNKTEEKSTDNDENLTQQTNETATLIQQENKLEAKTSELPEPLESETTKPKNKQLKKSISKESNDEQAKKTIKKPKGQKKKSIKHLYQIDDSDETLIRTPSKSLRKKPDISKIKTQKFTKPVEKIAKQIIVFEGITVNELAQKMAVKAADLIKILMKMGTMATINQPLDQETAILIIEEMGHTYIRHKEDVLEEGVLIDASQKDTKPRAPVVTIMGHVDHGKTSLLDYIRKTRVALAETGGITQHIGAYSVNTDKGKITFLDTPGHEAFTAMRARGASSTDIIILVVAADDGVMPQTIEAIQHAKAAGVPIVVAVNKIDKPDIDPEKVRNELSQHDVIPEDWGGDTIFVHVSAKSGQGIDALLDAVLLQAEVLELSAVSEGLAKGIVIESKLEKGRGVVATVLVQSGLLQQGDMVLCGTEYGKIRAMTNDIGQKITHAAPSTPVEILGLSSVPNSGDEIIAVKDDKTAREVAELRMQKQKDKRLKQQQAAKLSGLFKGTTAQQQKLNVILKADTQGSVEAIRDALEKLSTETDDISIEVIASAIGGINVSDVSLATASKAIIFGFNVRADGTAKKQAEADNLELRYYSIIYDLIDDVKKALSGMLSPEMSEKIVGTAEVRDVFRSSKFGAIAGCMVIDGIIKRNNPIRVLRDQVVIYEGSLESLKRFKDDVNEVKKGMECGIGVKNYNDVKVGDHIEIFEVVEVKRVIE